MEGLFWMSLFCLAFLILDIFCVIKTIEYFRLKKHGICCYAKVIRLDKQFSRTGYTYQPWFEYKTATGEWITVRCETSTSFKNAFSIGKKIKIHYSKDNPQKYIIDKNSLYVQIALLFIDTLILICVCSLFVDLLIRTINYKQ